MFDESLKIINPRVMKNLQHATLITTNSNPNNNNNNDDHLGQRLFDASNPNDPIGQSNLLDNFKCPFHNYYNYSTGDLDSLLTYKHYINGWVSLLVILVGILANLVTICALLHRYMRKSSTNAYLLALSSSNLFSLFCLLLMTGLRFTIVHPYRQVYCKNWYENFINLAIPYLTPINNLFQLSGIYLIMAVSIDRLIIVKKHVKPTDGNRKKRKFITWLVILFIFLFSFVFTLPNWFLYETVRFELNVTNRDLSLNYSFRSIEPKVPPSISLGVTPIDHNNEEYENHNGQPQPDVVMFKLIHFKTKYTQFGQIEFVKELLSIYLYIPFVFGLPIFILLAVNTLIIYELVKIGDRKRQLGTAARIDRNITLMLVMIVVVFLVCQVPLTLTHILIAYDEKLMFNRNFFIFNSFTNFLTCINLSVNFALFCFFGQAFRDTIQFMFCMRDQLPDQPSKRAPSLFFNNDMSRRSSSIFYSMYTSMVNGMRRSSSNDIQLPDGHHHHLASVYMNRNQHRKSLPALNNRAFMEKISEKVNEDHGHDHDHDEDDELDLNNHHIHFLHTFDESPPHHANHLTADVKANLLNHNGAPANGRLHVKFNPNIKDNHNHTKSNGFHKKSQFRRFSEQLPQPIKFNYK